MAGKANDGGEVAAAAKKRRRRPNVTGAADDCFACRQAGIACDRKRPYCTQCIKSVGTCSGYKTQLTWGVGVASRGKLRGQSLPVAKTKKAIESEKRDRAALSAAATAAAAASKPPPPPPIPTQQTHPIVANNAPLPSPRNSVSPSLQAQAPDIQFEPGARFNSPTALQSPTPTTSTPDSTFEWSQQDHLTADRRTNRHSMPHVAFSNPHSYTSGPAVPAILTPMSADRMSAMHWMSPTFVDQRRSTDVTSHPSTNSPTMPYDRNLSWASSLTSGFGSSMTSSPTLSSSPTGFFPMHSNTRQMNPFRGSFAFAEKGSISEEDSVESPTDASGSLCPLQIMSSTQLTPMGKTSQLRSLIRYYENVIAPVIVAFDGPENPYKARILRLATGSEALQHAIAALSASNLRMREQAEIMAAQQPAIVEFSPTTAHQMTVHRSSTAHKMIKQEIEQPEQEVYIGDQPHMQREHYHKVESVKALNQQLQRINTLTVSEVDAILGTLLVLCLYYICDTGVAKFKRQFAGVKRILEHRAKISQSTDSMWLDTMFRWFDSITATVNDRSSLFDESEVTLGNDEEWALESLAGCDTRLAKIISKLGRLNLLSQGRDDEAGAGTPTPPAHMPPRQPVPGSFEFGSDFGWGDLPAANPAANPRCDQFRREWCAVRQELEDWQFDATTVPASVRASTDAQQLHERSADLRAISESFRYSALLYIERLMRPRVPSTDQAFVGLVGASLMHIEAVRSDVYLLWPLFITGSECVLPQHRALIAARCRKIQGDSGFYNNASTLGLLEKVWHKKDNEWREANTPQENRNPFPWHKDVQHKDGEYIVI